MFVLRSMRKAPQRFLADVSVNHREPSGKSYCNTAGRKPVVLKLLRGTVRRTTACPGGPQLGLRIQPRSKRMTRPCGLAPPPPLLCSRASPWAMAGSRCGEHPGRRSEPTFAPPRPFVRSQLLPCAGQRLLAPAISGALSTQAPT